MWVGGQLVLWLYVQCVLSASIYVSPTAAPVSPCGSLTNPCRSIGEAISVAQDGDQVYLSDGTYYENSTILNVSLSFSLWSGSSAVLITTSWANTTLFNLRKPVSFTGVSFSSGRASLGGIFYVNRTWLYLTDCVLRDSLATGFGGGLLLMAANLTATNCTFSGNYAPNGGALAASDSRLQFTSCTFFNNTAEQSGGALYVEDASTLTLDRCLLSRNTAYQGGGFSLSLGPEATSTGSTYEQNTAELAGGAAFLEVAGLYDSGSVWRQNSAINGGGVCYDNRAWGTVTGSTFTRNSGTLVLDLIGIDLELTELT